METLLPETNEGASLKEKIDIVKYSVSRFDIYFQSVNAKIALYITLNTFVLTAATAGSRSIIGQFPANKNLPILFLTLIILASAVSIICTIKASIPYLKSTNASIFYFGYIANLETDDYCTKIDDLTNEKILHDLRQQACVLSKGLKAKYQSLSIAGNLLLIDFALIIIFSLIIITNIQ